MEKLKQILAQEDTVLFIGSGISLWSGLPSWSGLIEELAKFVESTGAKADLVRAEAQRGELLQAASYGFDKLTKQQIGDFIRVACRYGVAKPHEIHKKIVSLGPRCYVTTNYDNLIEEGLRKWQPDRFFRPPVTNRHLTETAEIVHARAIDFIFKPHGDAADSESIILTREQYRQMLPQGERHAALESLKMLLASRPFVYFGFGLRDPDFIYLRDLLANTYKGGTRDHYAIMPDVSDAEIDYWRRNYGIHLTSYTTIERPNKTRDHAALLTLLDNLHAKSSPSSPVAVFNPRSPDVVLALARHASGLTRCPKITPEFKIRVHPEPEKHERTYIYYRADKFEHHPVEKFLDDGPERALLIGLPGAGKTYSLRRATARMADKLHEMCLSDPFDEKTAVLPIFADLKLYRGDLGDLVSQTLPKSLPLDEIIRHFKVKIFLDSFNEMPREYWESGSYESDFTKFITRIGRASLIIGSRTSDGMGKFGLPAYCLDQIDEAAVNDELQRLGINIEGRFQHEVRQLLQRPFYFHYITSGVVRLPKEAHPRDFYQVLFENLRNAFTKRFGKQFDIERALSLVAYAALNRGEEAFPLSELTRVVNTSLEISGLPDIDVREVANWLVSTSVLIPYIGGRIAFVHQSITEYLAATELARQYVSGPDILKEKLTLTRWDQALFLTLSLLPPTSADSFLQDVVKADLALALNAAKYLEVGRDEVVAKLLSQILEQGETSEPDDWKITSAIEYRLPITESHESQLRALAKRGSVLGAAAVIRLVELKGTVVKDELLQLLFDNYDDFNLCCNGIGKALMPFASEEDVQKIAELADSLEEKVKINSDEDDDFGGFVSGAGQFLAKLDISAIRRVLLFENASGKIQKIRAQILCEILWKQKSTTALDLAGELLLKGMKEAAFAIHLISSHQKSDCKLSWESFTTDHADRLISILGDTDENWALGALENLCAARPDLAESVKQQASTKIGIEKVALLYCVSPNDPTLVFQALSDLVVMNEEQRRKEPVHILRHIDFEWAGKEELFIQLLRLRDKQLATTLFGGSCPPSVENLGNLEIGSIEWWLDWMLEVAPTGDGKWFVEQLGALFAEHLITGVQDQFVAEFNKSDSKYRRLLFHYVLPYRNDIMTDVFNEDAISFMLADLNRKVSTHPFRGNLLGRTATEKFVTERLLPLLQDAKPPLLENLKSVIKQAGTRHGRRYIFDSE
jgi:hypothetical protein